MSSGIYDFLSHFAWPLIWAAFVLTLIDAFDDHGETSENIKQSSGRKKYWLHLKRIRLWVLPLILGIGAILAQIGSEADEAKIVSLEGRLITPAQRQSFIASLVNAPKGKVIVGSVASNIEAEKYAQQISDMLKASGYDVENNFGSFTPRGVPTGIEISIKENGPEILFAVPIQNALSAIGIDAQQGLNPMVEDNSVLIFVWSKP